MSLNPDNARQLLDELQAAPVVDRARVLQGKGDPQTLLGELIEHSWQLTGKDATKADIATDVVVNLSDRLGSQLDRARARRARVRALSYAGRFDEALQTSSEGIRLAEEAGSSIEAGRARLVSMHALAELGRLEDAIRVGEAARQAFIESGERGLAALADINLGTTHQRNDQPATAVECFERARPALAGDPHTLGHLENNRGEALLALNDFRGAELAFRAARQAFVNANATLTASIAEGNLADLAARRGQLHTALFHFERARRSLEADAAPSHLARLLAEQAEALSALGMPQQSLAEYERALPELDRCGLALEAARARGGMGQALLRLGRRAEAETALAAAATAFEELGHATARAKVDLLRAESAASNGRTQDARTLALRALAALQDRPADSIAARLLLGRLAMQQERLAEADAELASATALAQEFDLAPLRADVLFARGLLRRRQGDLGAAIVDLSAAIEQIERVRGALQADRFRIAFLADRSIVYESLVRSLLERGGRNATADAFKAAEQAKSRALLEQMQGMFDVGKPRSEDLGEENLWERLSGARAELNALYSVLDDDRRASTPAAIGEWRTAVRQREGEITELENRLSTTRGIGALYAPTIRLNEVQQLLTPHAALIEYFIAEGDVIAFVIRHDRAHVFARLIDASELTQRLQRLQFQLNRALRPGALEAGRAAQLAADAQRELARLYTSLMAPMQESLSGVERLTIVPHGPLHLLPFHALHGGGGYLIERFEISYVPSANLLVHLHQAQESHEGGRASALVVGVADEVAPGIAEEARIVAEVLNCADERTLIGPVATTERVVAAAQHADIIHMACHGRFAADLPSGSGLKLFDRWLTVRDLHSMKLRSRLITLSGCETGVNLVKAGDELLGLLRGFFAAGAASLLVSLWRIDDRATKEFMADFYNLLNTMCDGQVGLSAALRQAQLNVLERDRHPALWAPFILVGRE